MKKYFLLFLLGFTIEAYSQIDLDSTQSPLPDLPNYKWLIKASLGESVGSMQLTNIQSLMKDNGINRNLFGSFGYYAKSSVYHHRFSVGIEGGGSLLNTPLSSNGTGFRTESRFASYGIRLGYVFYLARNRQWEVNMGYGQITSRLNIFQKSNNATISFAQLFTTSFAGSFPAIDHRNNYIGLSIENTNRQKKPTTFGMSIEIGVRRGIKSAAWQSDLVNFTNAPTDRVWQYYISNSFSISSLPRFSRQP